ncbi:MAG: hypothetical protein FWE35_11250 [Streptosporangiales bacterium]|jgi:hypothetical protein|nr:hypothetical protein [Streptosporangiales bacterium]
MRLATLLAWLLTVLVGAAMLWTWIARGGLRRERERRDGLPAPLIFGHALLAVAGLAGWILFLVSGSPTLAWASVGCVTLGFALGICTVTVWTPFPARRYRGRDPAEAIQTGESEPVITDEMITDFLDDVAAGRRAGELRPSVAVVVPVAHGLLAMTTLALAVGTAVHLH